MTGNTLMFLPIVYTRLLDSSRWQVTIYWFYLVFRPDVQIVQDGKQHFIGFIYYLD